MRWVEIRQLIPIFSCVWMVNRYIHMLMIFPLPFTPLRFTREKKRIYVQIVYCVIMTSMNTDKSFRFGIYIIVPIG